jgi:hypothetical protein
MVSTNLRVNKLANEYEVIREKGGCIDLNK